MTQLGTLEELPQDYRDAMDAASVGPLWPQMRYALPHNAPVPITKPHLWPYADVFAAIEHHADVGNAFLMQIHDGPLQKRLGFYEERAR